MSPFFSFLFFLRKGVLFQHNLLIPLGSGWGSGTCPLSFLFFSSGKELCSIMISLFLLVPVGVPVLVSLFFPSLIPMFISLLLSSSFPQEGVLFHHDLLVPARIPVFISLFFSNWGSGAYLSFFSSSFSQERDFIPSWIS